MDVQFLRRFAESIEFAKDALVVVGVSGGPDSMALLHLLNGLNKQHGWNLRLHIAHLNHQLRESEADKDAAFVAVTARQLGWPCTIESVDIAKRAKETGRSIEEIGRGERYAFFARVCEALGAEVVAVAHHSDDNAETILHRVLRGTGLRGLAGMAPSRPLFEGSRMRLIRPLLSFTRQELLEYLERTRASYQTDRTNEDCGPTRNRLRNEILPYLNREVNPKVRDALIRLGEHARWATECLGRSVQSAWERVAVYCSDVSLALDADALSRENPYVQTEVIRMAYRSFGLGERDLTFDHVAAVRDQLSEQAKWRFNLPGGLSVERQSKNLVFLRDASQPSELSPIEANIVVPGESVLSSHGLTIHCSIHELAADDWLMMRRSRHRLMESVDFGAVRPPLTVRRRRSGDRFVPLGAGGSQKLSDFFINRKVDRSIRDRTALLCDGRGPIWVVGHRIDDRVKLTANTRRVLRLTARPLVA